MIGLQDLEEKIEATADELRQEKRRLNSATLERERVEKVSAKLKEMARQLEGRLEKEERLSGKERAVKLFSRGGYGACVLVKWSTTHFLIL